MTKYLHFLANSDRRLRDYVVFSFAMRKVAKLIIDIPILKQAKVEYAKLQVRALKLPGWRFC